MQTALCSHISKIQFSAYLKGLTGADTYLSGDIDATRESSFVGSYKRIHARYFLYGEFAFVVSGTTQPFSWRRLHPNDPRHHHDNGDQNTSRYCPRLRRHIPYSSLPDEAADLPLVVAFHETHPLRTERVWMHSENSPLFSNAIAMAAVADVICDGHRRART